MLKRVTFTAIGTKEDTPIPFYPSKNDVIAILTNRVIIQSLRSAIDKLEDENSITNSILIDDIIELLPDVSQNSLENIFDTILGNVEEELVKRKRYRF